MSTITVKMLCAQAAFLFDLCQGSIVNGGNGCGIIQTINSKTTKKQPESPSQPVRFCVLSLFILALIKMRCGGFPPPGLGGYCGEEMGAVVDPPWAAHKKLLNPLSPLAAHPMWVLPSKPVAELRFAASAGW